MKKWTLVCIALFASILVMAQDEIKFESLSHNFGKIARGVNKSVIFKFTNNGAKPVAIEFAQAECGCTKPEYKQDPVLKGQSSTIKVTYTAPSDGVFKKKVTVKFAGVPKPIELEIQGEVIAK
jgi:hypothetical protein